MIPQIDGAITGRVKTASQPSYTYAVNGDQIVGNIDGLDAVRQSIHHILSTERYAYPIYGKNYGVELEQYRGCTLAYIQATIEDTLRDALLQDDRISGVTVDSVVKTGTGSALVTFTVECNHGTLSTEVHVNV